MTNWSVERDGRLRQLHTDGLPFSEIATELGVTRSAAISRARRLGLKQDAAVVMKNCQAAAEKSLALGPVAVISPEALPALAPAAPLSKRQRSRGADLLDRAPDGCCFIVAPPYLYCNEHRPFGFSYCEKHSLLVWQRHVR
jgi:hypothetical protein